MPGHGLHVMYSPSFTLKSKFEMLLQRRVRVDMRCAIRYLTVDLPLHPLRLLTEVSSARRTRSPCDHALLKGPNNWGAWYWGMTSSLISDILPD